MMPDLNNFEPDIEVSFHRDSFAMWTVYELHGNTFDFKIKGHYDIECKDDGTCIVTVTETCGGPPGGYHRGQPRLVHPKPKEIDNLLREHLERYYAQEIIERAEEDAEAAEIERGIDLMKENEG